MRPSTGLPWATLATLATLTSLLLLLGSQHVQASFLRDQLLARRLHFQQQQQQQQRALGHREQQEHAAQRREEEGGKCECPPSPTGTSGSLGTGAPTGSGMGVPSSPSAGVGSGLSPSSLTGSRTTGLASSPTASPTSSCCSCGCHQQPQPPAQPWNGGVLSNPGANYNFVKPGPVFSDAPPQNNFPLPNVDYEWIPYSDGNNFGPVAATPLLEPNKWDGPSTQERCKDRCSVTPQCWTFVAAVPEKPESTTAGAPASGGTTPTTPTTTGDARFFCQYFREDRATLSGGGRMAYWSGFTELDTWFKVNRYTP